MRRRGLFPANRYLRQVFFQDRHCQGEGHFPLILITMQRADEIGADAHFDRGTFAGWRVDMDAVIAKGGAQISLHAGDIGRVHGGSLFGVYADSHRQETRLLAEPVSRRHRKPLHVVPGDQPSDQAARFGLGDKALQEGQRAGIAFGGTYGLLHGGELAV